jgi:hypothetical protein
VDATGGKGFGKLWPVVGTLAALDLDVLGNDAPAAAIEVIEDGALLGLEAEA